MTLHLLVETEEANVYGGLENGVGEGLRFGKKQRYIYGEAVEAVRVGSRWWWDKDFFEEFVSSGLTDTTCKEAVESMNTNL